MEWVCGLAVALVIIAGFGHILWLVGAAILKAIFGPSDEGVTRPLRPFISCPACGTDIDDRDTVCPHCNLYLDSRLARDLYRICVSQREIRALCDRDQIDNKTADEVLTQLDARARSLQGLPAPKPAARRGVIRAKAVPKSHKEAPEPLPPDRLEKPATPAVVPEPRPEPV